MSTRSLTFSAAALVAVSFIACENALAQRVSQPSTNGSGPAISGKVIVPVAGFWDRVEVILEYETGVPVGYTNTDGGGYYAFYNLKPGRYFVLVELDGFEKVRERVDVVTNGVPPVQPIFLNPVATKDSSGVGIVDVELRRKYPKKAVDEYEKARADMAGGDLQKSAQRLTTALKEAPGFFEARSLLGTVYHKLRRYTDAELEYRKAHELNPQAVLPLLNLGTLYIESAERDPAAAETLFKSAYEALTKATKLDARSATALFLLGAVSFKTSRTEEAETHLKRALEINSRLGQAQIMLANVYLRQQKWEAALQTLDAYLRDHEDAEDAKQIKETRSKVAERVNASRK
jgi:tetratricopeptide (TPR) repeat protein